MISRKQGNKKSSAQLDAVEIFALIDTEIARLSLARVLAEHSVKLVRRVGTEFVVRKHKPISLLEMPLEDLSKLIALDPREVLGAIRIDNTKLKRLTKAWLSVLPDEPFPPLEPEKPKPTKATMSARSKAGF